MSLRLYTICAVLVTASAVAGLLVGGMVANGSRGISESPAAVSHSTPLVGVARP